MRYDDISPQDIDPDTGRPYAGYSSPSLDTSFHDHEMAVDDDDSYPPPCSNPGGHEWPRVEEHERCLCVWCGADGDA
jgi:hypothetical protein